MRKCITVQEAAEAIKMILYGDERMKHCKTRIVILILCLCLCACSSNKVTSIVLSNDTIDVTIGQNIVCLQLFFPRIRMNPLLGKPQMKKLQRLTAMVT